ncbi:acyl-CoA thioesterase [Tenacibaculum ovolyticum]|uniref:acyl-CoA thioesterase n=1 Tax=Tenacibaculum ovolyticum TaxID=104270 RepID=UPI001F231C7A|nr:acyl-CoA thioesterase [Tenacibaculum ovolyticum]
MDKLPKILKSKAKVRFQDCDPFNHLNNANYLNYFMNHREDQLIESYDIDIYSMAKTQGRSWVVGSTQIAYLKPAFLMEEIAFESQLIAYTNSELQVEMRMYDRDKSHLKSIVWCGFVHFNLLKQHREIHDNNLMELFKTVNTSNTFKTFEERLQYLKPNKIRV